MSKVVLSVNSLGKCYASYRNNFSRFAEWFGFRAKHEHEYWATQDINFALGFGEALALIGQNGAGKSTLLKLITGTIRSTTGTVQIDGRVSAILELGLGFNPDFTGRQNVYLAGGLMGLSTSQLTELMPSIEDFAELGEFIDQPLRVYSSGMQARLAFSVATAVRPDLLIVDEVLSVGDSYFQHKSFDRIRQFKEQGTALLFVTHSMGDVRALCDRVILLDQGSMVKDGLPDEVVDYYNAMIAAKENAKLTVEQRREKNGWVTTSGGSKEVELLSMSLSDATTGEALQMVPVGQLVTLTSEAIVRSPVKRLVLGNLLRDRTGHVVWGTNTWHTKQVVENLEPGQVIKFAITFPCALGPGSYSVTYNLVSTDTKHVDNYDSVDNFFVFDVINTDKPVFAGTTWLDHKITIDFVNG